MKRVPLQITALGAAGTALAMFAAPVSSADVTYMVTHLVDVDISFFGLEEGDILAINAQGEVVGSFVVDGHRHAFLWLPADNYGLSPGITDLHLAALDE
jgi:probable HAF family extracellular repeat protein